MRITDSTGGCWPTPFQQLLLKATLLEAEAALQAWQEWYGQGGLDRLDNGSYRLLPLTYRNLQRLGYQEPVLMKLRGVNRRAWCENHLVFRRIAPMLATFHDAGISTLLLKGGALTLLHYRDFGLRPMQDLDILVPEDRALDAISLLEAAGWSRNTLPAVRFGKFFLSYRQSAEFARQGQERLDLHWHVLFQACYGDADQPFWQASVPLEFEGLTTRALCPTDQLLHACAHGVKWDAVPPLRWVPDAFCILQSCAIDWPRLLRIAANCQVIPPLRDALRYLVNTLQAPVPTEVMQNLESVRLTPTGQVEYQYYLQPPDSRAMSFTMRALYLHYRRTVRGKSWLQQVVGLPLFLQHYWNLDRPWRVISRGLNFGIKRMRLAWSERSLNLQISSF
jgi:hypothetical protein